MKGFFNKFLIACLALNIMIGCQSKKEKYDENMKARVENFYEVELNTDLSWLSDKERQMISIFIDVADIMDEIFWMQSYGNKSQLMDKISDKYISKYALIHYGPWDRVDGLNPFVEGYGTRFAGANFYPADMSVEEFEAWDEPLKNNQYTLVRRNNEGKLVAVPYSKAYREQHQKAARLLNQAAQLADDPGLKTYLQMRAEALLTDQYMASDYAWVAMKDNNVDFIVGPIENYEDRLFGFKAAHEAFVLVKDLEWSAQLEKFNALLPDLQQMLPVSPKYKKEKPGTDADINVYYALYYAGDCNAGSKTIAINLPNAEEIHKSVGSRKLQLKNSMKAKFDHILVPISNMLICKSQRQHIKFDAFFENVTFHEVAHGMGIKNVVGGKQTVREALRDYYSSIEEAKADIMGLYLVTKLYEMGKITSGEVMDNYVTFFAGIFRSCRFGAASAHGKANMMAMRYFADKGAFVFQENGTYLVNFDNMRGAVESLVEKILIVQGDGNYEDAKRWVEQDGVMSENLKNALDKVNQSGIPLDIAFKQGRDVLGL